jgi:hypothetical protein
MKKLLLGALVLSGVSNFGGYDLQIYKLVIFVK